MTDEPFDTDSPTTEEGRDMLEHSVQYNPADADRAVVAAKIAKVEAEARAQGAAELAALVVAAGPPPDALMDDGNYAGKNLRDWWFDKYLPALDAARAIEAERKKATP
jgi:hypothetical protein